MAWTPLTFVSCGVLTAGMMNDLQGNFAALAGGQTGAPPLAVNSLIWSGVASGASLNVSSQAIIRSLSAGQSTVGSLTWTEVASGGSLNVSSMALVEALGVSKVASVGVLNISQLPGSSPQAHTLYSHPTSGSKGFAVPMDAPSVLASLAPVLTNTQGGIAAGGMESWHVVGAPGEPPYLNGFNNLTVGIKGNYAPTAFRKTADGRVHLRVNITGGTVGADQVIFILPVGYRPAGVNFRWVIHWSGYAYTSIQIVVQSNGDVLVNGLGNPVNEFVANEFSFFAEN